MTAVRRKGKPKVTPKRRRKSGAGYVYVLGSAGKGGVRTYVGWTNDLERRLSQHNAGTGARSTRGRVWFLLYAERLMTHIDAMKREWRLKRDRRLRKALLELLID